MRWQRTLSLCDSVMIPYGRQDITQDDIDAVIDVLKSDFITQGPVLDEFERHLCAYVGASHAVAVNSATSALHISCLALGLQPGDRLWTSPITFVASANCGLYCGAKVDFVDIDSVTYNLCPKALEKKLLQAEADGTLPKIVIPVHLCGQPCDMKAIHALSKRFGFYIIEDASHAIGGKYCDEPIGNCRYSDITVFSFHPVKIITTGEGGVAMTNNKSLFETMLMLRSHGITRDVSKMVNESDGSWYYEQIMLGFNYRMTDIQAALGISQLTRVDKYVARRHILAQRYNDLLSDLPLLTQQQNLRAYSAMHLYVIRLQLKKLRRTRKEIFDDLRDKGIGVNVHYIPVHLQPYYQEKGFLPGDFPESERYYEEAISLPLYPLMTNEQQDVVASALREVLQ